MIMYVIHEDDIGLYKTLLIFNMMRLSYIMDLSDIKQEEFELFKTLLESRDIQHGETEPSTPLNVILNITSGLNSWRCQAAVSMISRLCRMW